MKIVVADDLPASALDVLRAEGWEVDARTGRTPEQLSTDVADADAIVVRSATKVTAPIITAAPRLRVIARAGTGVDNVDVPAASARGIVVMNAPGANSISVAELALGQMPSSVRCSSCNWSSALSCPLPRSCLPGSHVSRARSVWLVLPWGLA